MTKVGRYPDRTEKVCDSDMGPNKRCLALFRSIWARGERETTGYEPFELDANLVDPSSFRVGIDKLVPHTQHVNLRRVGH